MSDLHHWAALDLAALESVNGGIVGPYTLECADAAYAAGLRAALAERHLPEEERGKLSRDERRAAAWIACGNGIEEAMRKLREQQEQR